MLKKLIILFAFLPVSAFGQRFELSAQAGVSGNLLPRSDGSRSRPYFALPGNKVGGINPVTQLSFYYLKRRLKIGATVRYFSTSAKTFVPGEGYRTEKLTSTIVQLLHELSYRFVAGKQFTFDAGVQAGPAWHTFSRESINFGQLNDDGGTIRGFVVGMNFTGRYRLSPLLSVNLSVNPLFDLLTSPGDFDLPMNTSRNHSTLCLPLTVGIGISI